MENKHDETEQDDFIADTHSNTDTNRPTDNIIIEDAVTEYTPTNDTIIETDNVENVAPINASGVDVGDAQIYKDTYKVSDLSKMDYLYTPPIGGYTTLLNFTTIINEDENMKAIQKNNGKKDALYFSSIMNTINGNSKVILDDPFSNYLLNGLFTNGLDFGSKTIAPKKLTINNGKGKNAVLAKISKSIASGENVQMPLWHSGFWITIKPPTSTELSILKRELDRNRLKLGRETGGLLYSNRTITLYKIVTDFILSKCINTTLELEENDDVRNYIFVEDIPLMILTVAIALYPNGFKTTIGCANNSVFDDIKKEPKCDFLETAIMDLETLIRVDKRRVDNFMLETLANRQPGSVSKLRIEEYRIRLTKHNKDYSSVVVKTEDGDDITINYNTLTLADYYYRGQLWIDSITKKIEDLVFDDTDDKDDVIDDLVTTSILGIYNTFVSSIVYDGETITDETTKLAILETLSSDDDIYTSFFAGIKKFLGETPIAVVATTNFICPKCKAERKPITNDSNWDEYIVLDPLNYFLDLTTLRLLYKMKR